ncbi:unnamed protein product [Rhizoctonia solani]|uniref:DUF6535 domain-containing protein n=1 Tax=Rhizoctonia solani TaxID=456999 RepID=A0A8H3BRH2_9AGAM|nr:unnamed protein product [Rhizoctonia solani]
MIRPRAKVEDELESRNGESIARGPGLESVNKAISRPTAQPSSQSNSVSILTLYTRQIRISGSNGLEPPLTALWGGFDEYGGELARDARIWSTYVREAERWDEDMVDGWNRSLDVILVFAALFSAISTAFLIESAKNLQPDPTETALHEVVSLLRVQVLNETSPTETGFTPSLVAVWVNGLWFLSLSLSVSVSLVAMLAKQWCYSYMSGRTGQPHVQARSRQRRLDGLERWKMPEILAFLPTLMHLSLVLFFVGLTIYLWDIHIGVAIPVLSITALTFIFYATTTILPLGNAYCPYNTPLSHYIDVVLRKFLSPFRKFGFTQRFLAPQYDSDAAADLTSDLSDQVTSRALGWLITHSQDERSVDLALQAIAGADVRMPVQPLIESNVVGRLATRFMACFSHDSKIRLAGTTLPQVASLYGRALTFVMSCAPDQMAMASELKSVTGTAPDRRPSLMDAGFRCLYDRDIIRTNSNVAAFGAASMGIWREFWTQVEWTWPKAPITTSCNILKKHVQGEFTLHSSAVVALVNTIALEAARWFDPRYAQDRGHVAMVLVKLLAQTSLNSFDPIRRAIAVALASFTLAIHDYPGGARKPSAESRMRRAQTVIRMYGAGPHRDDDYNELLVFGVLGLLKDPQSYAFESEQVAEIAALLRTTFKTDTNSAPLPFLPPSFNLDDHLVKTVLVYLVPPSRREHHINELARTELLKILTLPSHLWAHNEECYRTIANTLLYAKTVELKLGCLIAIDSQWMHTPITLLLQVLFNQEIFQKFLDIMNSNHPVLTPMAMVQLRNMVIQLLDHTPNTDPEKPVLDVRFALECIKHSDLFSALAALFVAPYKTSLVGPHHVELWFQPLEALSREFPRDVLESDVLLIMAVGADRVWKSDNRRPVKGDEPRLYNCESRLESTLAIIRVGLERTLKLILFVQRGG